MTDEAMARAQTVFETLCATLDSHEWKYRKDEEQLRIECSAQGEDLPMGIVIRVHADRQLIMLLSDLPFIIPEDKRLDVAIAVSMVNNNLVDGSFDYDIAGGRMMFRMTSSFIESEIGNELFSYMLMCSCHTVDRFNDKFLMLGKGMMSVEDFLSDH